MVLQTKQILFPFQQVVDRVAVVDIPALVHVRVPVVLVHVRVVDDKANKMTILDRYKHIVLPSTRNLDRNQSGVAIQQFYKTNGQGTARVHLRIDPDGSGVLFVNANTIYHLNPSATRMASLCLNDVPEDKVIKTLRSDFSVSAAQIKSDYAQFSTRLQGLLEPEGGCPICDFEIETTTPFSNTPSAPYRMDLALTYRCNNACSHCYNESLRDRMELSKQAWIEVLTRLWSFGIPHIVFTGGEPTLSPDLFDLIRFAESQGQITGLNTNGRKLKDPSYASALADAGLDHTQITIESHLESIHDQMVVRKGAWKDTSQGIQNALASRLFVMTNTTLLRENAKFLRATLEYLADLGVPTIGLNALIYSGSGKNVGTGLDESELPDLLEIAREITIKNKQRLIWYTPTQYCHFDPVQMQLGVKGCTAALYNMCIEPDGSVIPCQSYYSSLGNILSDPWESIWNHPLAQKIRNRALAPSKCLGCTFLPECGGGCPLESSFKEPEPQQFFFDITS